MLILIIFIIIIYILIYNKIDTFYLKPIKVDKLTLDIPENKDKIINIDNEHYAIYEKRNTDRILLISSGNKGNLDIYHNALEKFKNLYDYDIIYYEYPGFGCLDKEHNIDNCIEETYYWIQYIKKLGYNTYDFMGFSIGGGILIECLIRYNITYANNIYLIGTFTSISELLYETNYFKHLLHKLFLNKHNLDTYYNLKNIHCNKLYIIHSKEDDRIPYNLALKNFSSKNNYIKNKIFIEIKGNHKNLEFESNLKL
jgi:hypothetical protein